MFPSHVPRDLRAVRPVGARVALPRERCENCVRSPTGPARGRSPYVAEAGVRCESFSAHAFVAKRAPTWALSVQQRRRPAADTNWIGESDWSMTGLASGRRRSGLPVEASTPLPWVTG